MRREDIMARAEATAAALRRKANRTGEREYIDGARAIEALLGLLRAGEGKCEEGRA